MKATCPNNPKHTQFITAATVVEDWVVDAEGNYIDEADTDPTVVHRPDSNNSWTCVECGATATVED